MFTLKKHEFERISQIAAQRWGLHMPEKKISTVTSRMAKLMRKSNYSSVKEALEHIEADPSPDDLLEFFDVLSTNTTSFFRDKSHFDYLEREFYTPLQRGNLTLPGKHIRIWSAACSRGHEPYTIAINALESLPSIDKWDFQILATDLSSLSLQEAQRGIYDADQVDTIDSALLRKYFLKRKGDPCDQYKVSDAIRSLVTIRRLNLMDSWPMKGPFNAIFCRNVMIYFDKPTRERLVNRMCDLLLPGGVLAIGSAETLSGLRTPLRPVAANIYMK